MQENKDRLVSTKYGNLFQVPPELVHGDRDYREWLKGRYDFWETIYKKAIIGNGLDNMGFSQDVIFKESEKCKVMMNHYAGLLETVGNN